MAVLLNVLDARFILIYPVLEDRQSLSHFPILGLDPPLESILHNLYNCAMGLITQHILWCHVVMSVWRHRLSVVVKVFLIG